jgi:hypothetical protein
VIPARARALACWRRRLAIVNFLSMLGPPLLAVGGLTRGRGKQRARARGLPGVEANLLAGRLPLKKATATIAG